VSATLAVLLLHPILAEPGALRLVASGTGMDTVEWWVDGNVVGVGVEGSALTVNVTAGEHSVVARTVWPGPWEIMARPDPHAPGLTGTPAWTASSPGLWPDDQAIPTPWLLPLLGLMLALVPARGSRRRRSRHL